jgi:2-polyprenyl-3-methyl-5-hydroxy-6-metoxy-1,4-benzoquinol methylase
LDTLETIGDLVQIGTIADEISNRYDVIPWIHKDDFIFQSLYNDYYGHNLRQALDQYFLIGDVNSKKVGELAVGLLKDRPDEAILVEPVSILDFAAGYGCVARFIAKVFAKAAFCAIDIHQQAVEFNRQRLGLDAELSKTDPTLLEPTRQYDIVFTLSFFSHLPRTTFDLWLKTLLKYVKQNGLLIFTTHGRASHRLVSDFDIDHEGYGFKAFSEQKDLSPDDYGITITYPEYVQKILNGIDNAELVYFHHAFWWTHQDCYVLRKREDGYMRLPELQNREVSRGFWVNTIQRIRQLASDLRASR